MTWMMNSLLVMLISVGVSTRADDSKEPKSAAAQLDEIRADLDRNSKQYSAELQQAKDDGERNLAVDRFIKELKVHLDRAFEWVDANPNDPQTADTLKLIVNRSAAGPTNHSERALQRLVRDFPEDPKAAEIVTRVAFFPHWPISEIYLKTVLERNPLESNKAAACFALGEHYEHKGRLVQRMKSNESYRKSYEESRGVEAVRKMIESTDVDRSDEEAIKYFEMTADRFGSLIYHEKLTYAEVTEGRIDSVRNLVIGNVAPDIQGKDSEGKSFSLSEYRGKVVLLTFSGNWCGPCVGMYPHEREIVKRYENKPFVMLSVMTDDHVNTLKKAIEKGDITWRCWFEGGTDGPIVTSWGISGFPTIYLLDEKGVIRDRNLRGKELDEALEKLMSEVTLK
jgi:thiol-disulfide isomerase/thioredoxin